MQIATGKRATYALSRGYIRIFFKIWHQKQRQQKEILTTKANINKWDYIKPQSFCTETKETIKKNEKETYQTRKSESEVSQLCTTLCDPMDCSLTGFSIHGIFHGQEYWSGLPFPSPGDLPDPGIEPRSPASYADALPSEPQGK